MIRKCSERKKKNVYFKTLFPDFSKDIKRKLTTVNGFVILPQFSQEILGRISLETRKLLNDSCSISFLVYLQSTDLHFLRHLLFDVKSSVIGLFPEACFMTPNQILACKPNFAGYYPFISVIGKCREPAN